MNGWNQVSRHNFDRHLAERMEPIYHRWPSNKSIVDWPRWMEPIYRRWPSNKSIGWNRSIYAIVDWPRWMAIWLTPMDWTWNRSIVDGHQTLAERMEPKPSFPPQFWPTSCWTDGTDLSSMAIKQIHRWLTPMDGTLRSLTPMACLSTNSSAFSVLCLEYSTISPTNPSLTGPDGLSLDEFVQLLFEWLILDSKYVWF
jgi:hypothetical protein